MGDTYAVAVSNSASFTMVRCEVTDYSSFWIDSSDALLKDNYLANGVTVGPNADGAQIFHNVLNDLVDLVDGGANTVLAADGWSNVSTNENTSNNLGLNLVGADVYGNLFIQPGETVQVSMDVDSLNVPVIGNEALLGFNSRYMGDTGTVTVAAAGYPWTVKLPHSLSWKEMVSTDRSIRRLAWTSEHLSKVVTNDAAIMTVGFQSTLEEGITKVFFRTVESGHIPDDTRFTVKTNASPAYYIAPFTMNSGYIVIDGTAPETSMFIGFQTQEAAPPMYLIRQC